MGVYPMFTMTVVLSDIDDDVDPSYLILEPMLFPSVYPPLAKCTLHCIGNLSGSQLVMVAPRPTPLLSRCGAYILRVFDPLTNVGLQGCHIQRCAPRS
jgi:hypothetical protein